MRCVALPTRIAPVWMWNGPNRLLIEPLQEIVSPESFIVEVHHPFFAPPHQQSLPCCNTIARPLRNIRPASNPPFVCRAPYNIGNGIIV